MIIHGVELNNNKKIYSELLKIYGLGPYRVNNICNILNLHSKLVNSLTNTQQTSILSHLSKYILEDSLRKIKSIYINRLITNGSYRGLRHKSGLPVRGQRTRTNSKTVKKLFNLNNK